MLAACDPKDDDKANVGAGNYLVQGFAAIFLSLLGVIGGYFFGVWMAYRLYFRGVISFLETDYAVLFFVALGSALGVVAYFKLRAKNPFAADRQSGL